MSKGNCSKCDHPLFIVGKGSQIKVSVLNYGEEDKENGGIKNAQSLYRCKKCNWCWIVNFPDGSVFMA